MLLTLPGEPNSTRCYIFVDFVDRLFVLSSTMAALSMVLRENLTQVYWIRYRTTHCGYASVPSEPHLPQVCVFKPMNLILPIKPSLLLRFLKADFTNSVIALNISIISIPTVLKRSTRFRQPSAINAVCQLLVCQVQEASVRTDAYDTYRYFLVTPILTAYMCVWGNYILIRWLRMNEATSVNIIQCILCFKHGITFQQFRILTSPKTSHVTICDRHRRTQLILISTNN